MIPGEVKLECKKLMRSLKYFKNTISLFMKKCRYNVFRKIHYLNSLLLPVSGNGTKTSIIFILKELRI